MFTDSMEDADIPSDYDSNDFSNEQIMGAPKEKEMPEANKVSLGPASRFGDVKIRSLKVSKAKSDDTKAMMKHLKKSFVMNEETHRPNQNFHCLVCAKDFIKFGNAMDHVRTHFYSKPYNCKGCGHSFV